MADVPSAQTKQEIETLLDDINTQISQSIQNIGSAAQGQYDVEANLNNLMKLHSLPDKGQYLAFIKAIRDGQIQNMINQNINLAERGDTNAINLLKQILTTNTIRVYPPRNIGGKRRVTRKNRKQKGGFTYKPSSKRQSLTSRITSKRSSRRSSR